jgi:hypothetical protein
VKVSIKRKRCEAKHQNETLRSTGTASERTQCKSIEYYYSRMKSCEYYYSRRKSCESTASEGNPVIGTASEGNPVNRTASEVKNSIRRKPCEKL